MFNEEKKFYVPGTICRVRHKALSNVPTMFVVDKVSRTIYDKNTDSSETVFIGIKCRWFDKTEVLREAVFSTKDLEIIDNE